MAGVAEPATGLVFYELSHEWGHGAPALPGFDDVKLYRSTQHAKNGVMAHRIRMVMHSGTHLNAPLHLIQGGAAVGRNRAGALLRLGRRPLDPEGPMGADRGGRPRSRPSGDRGGRHRRHRHRLAPQIQRQHRVFRARAGTLGRPPPTGWSRSGVKLVAVDTPQIDHPLATSLGKHRNGPQMKRLPGEYEAVTGRSASADFPAWNPAHRALLAAGIPTIENAGGDLDALVGKRCTFQAYPWYWLEGDACPIRFVAFLDPAGTYRLEPERRRPRRPNHASRARARSAAGTPPLPGCNSTISAPAGGTACRSGRRRRASTC